MCAGLHVTVICITVLTAQKPDNDQIDELAEDDVSIETYPIMTLLLYRILTKRKKQK